VTAFRPCQIGWSKCSTALVALVVAYLASPAGVAQAADADPNLPAVQVVCGRCHTIAVFQNKPRSWERWNDVFADMTQRGAKGTDEQLERVTKYFLENLTLININTSPPEELAWVLGVDDAVAQAIVTRRQERPYASIEELRAVSGVDSGILEQRKSRILF